MAEKPVLPQVTDSNAGPAGTEAAELQARIEELERENEALRQRSAKAPPAPAHPGRGRNGGAIALAVIASLLLALAVPAIWLNRMVTDTNVYVATVAPLASNPDVQNAVADAASTFIIGKVDAKTRIDQVLPPNLKIIAAPMAQAVNDFVTRQSLALVRSKRFAQAWVTVNRASHKALVAAVTGKDSGIVGVQAGTVTLDVQALTDELKSRLVASGLGFVANLPTSSLGQQVVLFKSPALARLTTTFDLFTKLALWLPFLGLAFAAGAVALAVDRRKALLWLGGALAVAAMLPLQGLYLGQTYIVGQLYQLGSVSTPAAQAAFDIIFRDLVAANQAVIVLGVVVWLGAFLAGPARWAVALRTGLAGGLSGVASHLELGRFGEWVRANKNPLRAAGIAGAVIILLLLPAPRTVGSILWVALAYVVWLLLVGLLGAEPIDASIAKETGDQALDESSPPSSAS